MLDQYQRRMVEDIKDARTLKITVGGVNTTITETLC